MPYRLRTAGYPRGVRRDRTAREPRRFAGPAEGCRAPRIGLQDYNIQGRFNGKPSAILALFQLPGTNALDAVQRRPENDGQLKESFPSDLDYGISLDTTRSVAAGFMKSS